MGSGSAKQDPYILPTRHGGCSRLRVRWRVLATVGGEPTIFDFLMSDEHRWHGFDALSDRVVADLCTFSKRSSEIGRLLSVPCHRYFLHRTIAILSSKVSALSSPASEQTPLVSVAGMQTTQLAICVAVLFNPSYMTNIDAPSCVDQRFRHVQFFSLQLCV